MLKLRRVQAGQYEVLANTDFNIVRTEHDWDDENYSPARRRRAYLWEIIERGPYSWEVRREPFRTLREARQSLCREL